MKYKAFPLIESSSIMFFHMIYNSQITTYITPIWNTIGIVWNGQYECMYVVLYQQNVIGLYDSIWFRYQIIAFSLHMISS